MHDACGGGDLPARVDAEGAVPEVRPSGVTNGGNLRRVRHESADEVMVVDPTTGGAKGQKLARFDLIPALPLTRVAECFGRGATKYDERNWERGHAWSLSFAALQRHAWAFWSGEDVDPASGNDHLAAVVFHALSLMEYAATHPGFDDRPAQREGRPMSKPPR